MTQDLISIESRDNDLNPIRDFQLDQDSITVALENSPYNPPEYIQGSWRMERAYLDSIYAPDPAPADITEIPLDLLVNKLYAQGKFYDITCDYSQLFTEFPTLLVGGLLQRLKVNEDGSYTTPRYVTDLSILYTQAFGRSSYFNPRKHTLGIVLMNVLHAFERTDLAINMVRSFKKEYIPESAVLLMQHVQAWRMDQANNGLSDKETQRLMSKEWREMLTEQYPTLQALWASCPKPINFTSLV